MDDGIRPCMGERGVALHHVLCNSFGFGGNDTSLVLSDRPVADRTQLLPEGGIRVLSKVEISSTDRLADIRRYVKPLEARRMGTLMKSSLLASLEALAQAGIAVPDAIVTATAYGCLDNSERLLAQLHDEGETALKPTLFMQSTHNTLGSNVAIKTGCHGYNVTYTQAGQSLDWALRDARLLLRGGRVRTVLVGCHDERTPLFGPLLERATGEPLPPVHSVAMVLSCGG